MTIKEDQKVAVSVTNPRDSDIPIAVAVAAPIPVAVPVAATPITSTTTTTTTKVIQMKTGLSSKPERMSCQYCNQSMVTRTQSEIDGCTIALVVLLLLLFWPLFWVPLICKDVRFRFAI